MSDTPVDLGASNTMLCVMPELFWNVTAVPFGTLNDEGSKLAPCMHNVFAGHVPGEGGGGGAGGGLTMPAEPLPPHDCRTAITLNNPNRPIFRISVPRGVANPPIELAAPSPDPCRHPSARLKLSSYTARTGVGMPFTALWRLFADYSTNSTGMCGDTASASFSASQFVRRTHPCELASPIVSGLGVP